MIDFYKQLNKYGNNKEEVVREFLEKSSNILELIEGNVGFIETEETIWRSRMGKASQHVDDSKSTFAIISTLYSENTIEEKKELHHRFKGFVRNNLNLGYIDIEGSCFETNEGGEKIYERERSLLIPNIDIESAIILGVQLNQESILFKDKDRIANISTNTNNVGTILIEFKRQTGADIFGVSSKIIKQYFTKLLNSEEEIDCIFERVAHSNFVMIHSQGKPKWKIWDWIFRK